MSNSIALFGGAFDPITVAHEQLAKMVYSSLGMEVWLMPCFDHVYGKRMTAADYRWNMVQLVTQDSFFLKECNHEIRTQHEGSMYETLHALTDLYPGTLFHLVIGMDNANSIHRWRKGELLVREYPCVVIGRKGYQSLTEWYLNPPHRFLPFNIELCASNIREAIESGKNDWAEKNLNPKVWEYIQTHKLYKERAS